MAKIATLRTRIRARVCAHLTLRYKKSFGFFIPVPLRGTGYEPGGSRRLTTVRLRKRKAAARNVT